MSRLQIGICGAMTESVHQKLQSAGVRTVIEFVSTDLDVLAAKSGVSFRDLLTIRRVLLAQHSSPILSGTSFFDSVIATASILSTGCRTLDDLLDGGIFSGELTEIVGTQEISVNTVFNVVSCMKKNVIYIDVANRFNPQQLVNMFTTQKHAQKDIENALQRVRVVQSFDLFELLGKLYSLSESLAANDDSFYASLKLIVVDGIPEGIIPSLTERGDTGCGYIAQLSANFRQLASEFSLAVLLCTQTNIHSRTNNSARFESVWRIWEKTAHTRLEVQQAKVAIAANQNAAVHFDSKVIDVVLTKCYRQGIGQCLQVHVDEQGHLEF